MPDKDIMNLIRMLLKETARIFYNKLDEETKSCCENFKVVFCKRFKDVGYQQWRLYKELWQSKQAETQSAIEYMNDMEKVTEKLKI